MPMKKFCLFFAAGAALLFSGVALAERYLFKPPVNLGPPINTTFNERDPFITADSQKLFFVTDWPEGNLDIWMSTWNGTNWGVPVNCGPNVNSGVIEWGPSTSPDGKRLYFNAFGRPGSQGGWDVWYSDWDSALQQWGPAQNMGPVINTFGVDWGPEISRNGQSIYYSTNGFGHGCGQALYRARWNGSSWNTPEPLPLMINNNCTEERPSLTLDERVMYFVRWFTFGPQIFAAGRTSADSNNWNQPAWLDSSINDSCGTTDPFITSDGNKLYFASGKGKGTCAFADADIWVSERAIAGDLNLDDQITTSDVVLELNKVFLGELIPATDAAADLNCDGKLSSSDVVLLLNRAFLGIPFPC